MTVQGPVKEQQPDGMSHRGGWLRNVAQPKIDRSLSSGLGHILLDLLSSLSVEGHRRQLGPQTCFTLLVVLQPSHIHTHTILRGITLLRRCGLLCPGFAPFFLYRNPGALRKWTDAC